MMNDDGVNVNADKDNIAKLDRCMVGQTDGRTDVLCTVGIHLILTKMISFVHYSSNCYIMTSTNDIMTNVVVVVHQIGHLHSLYISLHLLFTYLHLKT